MRMTRRVPLMTAAVLAVALFWPGAGVRAQRVNPSIQIDPVLLQVLATTASNQAAEAVVTFNQYPGMLDLAAVRATGVQVLEFHTLPMLAVRGTPAQISNLFALPGVRSIYYNRRLIHFLDESVPLIGADRVKTEFGVTGKGVGVAIIDTGIDATHPDLPFGAKVVQNVKVEPNFSGGGGIFVEGLANTDTTSGHGTHVASSVGGTGAALGGKYTGVAPGSHLVGLGSGETMIMLSALEAFDWVLTNWASYGIRVISNSWGTTGPFSPDAPINVATRRAHDAGLVVVFAVGNAGPNSNTLNPYCVAPWVICVAAGLKDGRTLADFSSRGIPGDPLYHPTITAPGVQVAAARATTGIWFNTVVAADQLSIGSDAIRYLVLSGTSQATPHVSGTVALMLEANPALTPDTVKSVLTGSATSMPGYEQYQVGAGYLNAYAAVRSLRGLAAPVGSSAVSQ
jgi:serine protease AprX